MTNSANIDKLDNQLKEISPDKKIILFGAQNPQSKRKGWNILVETLKKIDTSKYFLLLFGSFWSHKTLNKIGIEYLSLGFLDDKKKLKNKLQIEKIKIVYFD